MEEHRDSQRSPSAMKRAFGAGMQPTPLRFLAIIIAGISIAETIAMMVVYSYRFLPYHQQVLLDALVMVIIISPMLYLLSTKPLLQQIKQRAQTERVLQARLALIQYAATHILDELLQFTSDRQFSNR